VAFSITSEEEENLKPKNSSQIVCLGTEIFPQALANDQQNLWKHSISKTECLAKKTIITPSSSQSLGNAHTIREGLKCEATSGDHLARAPAVSRLSWSLSPRTVSS